jgi:TetR/AcrR family transcriptional regulator
MSEEANTEQKIIAAAKKVFTEKGLDGARMQDIADEAGENKALLHYYFRSKQKLFQIVFEEQLGKMFEAMRELLKPQGSVVDRLERFILEEHEIMSVYPMLPLFVLNESARNPEMLQELFAKKPIPMMAQALFQDLRKAMDRGDIKDMDERQIMINALSLIIYPMIARPVLKRIFNLDEEGYKAFLEERKYSVIQFIKDALKP